MLLPPAEREALVGDLLEEYVRIRKPRSGRLRALLWLCGQVARSTVSLLLARIRSSRSERLNDLPERRGDAILSRLLQDFRYGVRTLLKSPAFSIVTIVTLALAIGVNSAIFSMLNVLLLKPLPLGDPDTAAFVYSRHPERGVERAPVSVPDFLDLRREVDAFAELGAVDRGAAFVLTGLEEPIRVAGFRVTSDVLDIWQLPVVLGRSFQPGDDRPGAERVALLAHRTWQERFAGDREVAGRVVEIDGFPTTIVGVVSPEIELGSLATAEIWLPLVLDETRASRDVRHLWITGRLADGTTLAQARQEVEATTERIAREHPEEAAGWRLVVLDMNQALAPPQTWTIMFLLALTVGLVMLIACSNVATLMITRAHDRGRELAVRAAIGAGRGRILSQLLTESLLLALAAGALGLVLARACLAGLVWMAGANSGLTNFFAVLTIDRNVLLFTLAVSLSAPVLFGLLPALRASRPDLSDALREGARGASSAREIGRRVLVGGQIALALALVTVAGLSIQSMAVQYSTPVGFDTDQLLTLRVDLPTARYETEESWRQFFAAVDDRLRTLPGVESISLISHRYAIAAPSSRDFRVEGQPLAGPSERPYAGVRTISAGTLARLGIPLQRGREFTTRDDGGAPPVAIVNSDAARRFWPDDDPVGSRIRLAGDDEPWREVVGVATALATGDPSSPSTPSVYVPFAQNPRPGMGVLIRSTTRDPLNLVNETRRAIWSVDPDQPIGDVRTMERAIDDALRAGTTLLSIFVVFAFFALLMAGAGLYGVVSYTVGRRTREIGIRMALGAHDNDVIRLIARQTAWLVGAGLLVGSVVSVVVARVLASALATVETTDPLLILGVVAVLALTTAIATLVPTRRAIGVEPVTALREE